MSGVDQVAALQKALAVDFCDNQDQFSVAGDGYAFTIDIYSPSLVSLSPLKQQQRVYASINSLITDGSVHAVTIKVLNEWID